MSYDIDPDALASALPAGITYEASMVDIWHPRRIAEFQAERLAEAGWRLVHDEHGDSALASDEATVARVARALIAQRPQLAGWDGSPKATRDLYRRDARAVLAALAEDPAVTSDE